MRRRGNFHLVSEPCHGHARHADATRGGGAGQKTATTLAFRSEMGHRSQSTGAAQWRHTTGSGKRRAPGFSRLIIPEVHSSSLHQLRIFQNVKRRGQAEEGRVYLSAVSAPPTTTRQTSSPMESCLRPVDCMQKWRDEISLKELRALFETVRRDL